MQLIKNSELFTIPTCMHFVDIQKVFDSIQLIKCNRNIKISRNNPILNKDMSSEHLMWKCRSQDGYQKDVPKK